MQCSAILKNISLATDNYTATFRWYPPPRTSSLSRADDNGEVGVAWTYAISRFIEADASADQIQDKINRRTIRDPWLEPEFYRSIYPEGRFACPSDVTSAASLQDNIGQLSYRTCLGDSLEDHHLPNQPSRGMFSYHRQLKPADIVDGLSNTIQFLEMASGIDESRFDSIGGILWVSNGVPYSSAKPADCRSAWTATDIVVQPGKELTGTRWADGRPYYSSAVTALPPNSPKCATVGDQRWGVYSAGSRHPGGCHASMGDGSVRFVTSSIEAGNSSMASLNNLRGPSPYGLWGAMGTRSGQEVLKQSD